MDSALHLKKPLHNFLIYSARQYAKLYPKDLFIAVAGSLGNSICVEASTAILSQKFKTVSTVANLDPIINIPKTILKLSPSIKKGILEMGVDFKGEMDFYLSLIKPKVAVFTKLDFAQSDSLISIDDVILENSKLISQLPEDGVAILNWDDISSKKLAQNCSGKIMYYGTDPKNCSIWAGNIKIEDFRTTFELNLGVERVKVNLQLLGTHQIYPVLAAASLGVLFDIPLTKIKVALESIQPQNHKLQAYIGPNGSILLDDSLNSSPADLEAAIDTTIKIPAKRRILVLGEMKGLGNYSDPLHRQVAQMIYKEKFDQILLGLGDANIIADELKNLGFWDERISTNLQNSQIVGILLKSLGKGDVCLIKGSRSARLDEVVKRITKK